MALELYLEHYCWTCGTYRELNRETFMCRPCTESWLSRISDRRW
jgi:hypothetical protein